MDLILVALSLVAVIVLYFKRNPIGHSPWFMWRRFFNWFPMGMTYAFLYMGRYNLVVYKNALGADFSHADFGIVFGVGTAVYAFSFLINGPLVDKLGGRAGIIISAVGSALANIGLGYVTYLFSRGELNANLPLTLAAIYGLNMYFQSYGAVSIIKVKAYWFHVKERGIFGGIFGTLISFGVYFAFDWGSAIVRAAKALPPGTSNEPAHSALHHLFDQYFSIDATQTNADWLVFLIPAALILFWSAVDFLVVRDAPSHAGLTDFDTHDASSGEMHIELSTFDLLKRVFTSPIMMVLAGIEFTSGAIRNGVMQWYTVYMKQLTDPALIEGGQFFVNHWGLLTCITGIAGGFAGGWISDHVFSSRRGPPVTIFALVMFFAFVAMTLTLGSSSFLIGCSALVILTGVIGVHALMSGTAAADFGGRKATATASGIVDGFVYLGSSVQSVALGFLVTKSWSYWPVFLIPFCILAFVLSIRIWTALPKAMQQHLGPKAARDLL